MELMVDCPRCHKWKIHSSDRFCSWCGIKLVNVEIKPEKMRFYIDKEKRECSHTNTITLDNSSGWTDVKGIPPVAHDKSIFKISNEVQSIRQGETEQLPVAIVDAANIQPGTSSHIVAEISGEQKSIDVEFYYSPQWTMEFNGEQIAPDSIQKLYKFQSIPKSQIDFKIYSLHHTVFDIDDIYTDDDRYEVEMTKKAKDRIEGRLHIDTELLEVEMEEYVELKIKGQHTNYEAHFSFYIQLSIPPDFYLMVDGSPYKEGKLAEIDIYEGIDNEIEIKIFNSSNEKLTITEICADLPFIDNITEFLQPKELVGGQDLSLKLKIDAAKVVDDKSNSCVTIRTYEIAEKKINFLIEKKTAGEYEGFLAVDFGTTNTTIAYKLPGDKCRFIPLEEMADKEKAALSPSVIRYEKIVNEIPERYYIGEYAKSLLILNPNSSVMSIKTSLGAKEKIKILPVDESSGSTYFTPLEVTKHMVSRLKELCEQTLKRKISNAIITHPSKFTHVQIEELINAFKMAGIETKDTIEEPEAAALNYIIDEKKNESGSNIIGIFDCGGGTTDITMLSVTESQKNNQRILDVKVLGTDGDRSFGGNDLTELMMEIIAEKIMTKQFKISRKDLNIEGLKLFYKKEDELNEKMIKIMLPKGKNWERTVRENRMNLWRRAEQCKIILSDIKKSEIETYIGLTLVTENDELEPIDAIVTVEKREFEDLMDSKLDNLVDKLKRMQEKTGQKYDLILLSGMSSQVPLIYQKFSDNFDNPVEYVPELKKCVALGALEYYELKSGLGALQLNFEKGKKLRNSIGIPITTTGGKRRFYCLFPHGAQLPVKPVKVDFPLRRRMMLVAFENSGTQEYFEDAPDEFRAIKQFDIVIPKEITDAQIIDVELYMNLKENLSPTFSIRLGDILKEFS